MSHVILHLGLGAFHRAHQAAYTQDANAAAGTDWTIEAVSMRNPDPAQKLNAQSGRFSLIVRHPNGPQLSTITCMGKAWSLPHEPAAIIGRMASGEVAVVTITVTEKGYCATAEREPAWSDPIVAHDLANPTLPKGLLGLVNAGCAARKAAGLDGLTFISCDNLPNNGAVLAKLVDAYTSHVDPALAEWIRNTCTFPSTMVDRITPASTEATFALAQNDPLAVETEPFRQWAIEDRFAGPRPPWEEAGVQFVVDVRPFEEAKLRMLNGAHSFIAYAGALLGKEMVRDVMADPLLAKAVRWHMNHAANSLDAIDGFDPAAYADDLVERFSNPAIAHNCLQIATDGSQKLPQRIFAPAVDLHAKGQSMESCAMIVAVWLRFLQRQSEAGSQLPLNDPLAAALGKAVQEASGDAQKLVAAVGGLLGPSADQLWAIPQWPQLVCADLEDMRRHGLSKTLQTCVD